MGCDNFIMKYLFHVIPSRCVSRARSDRVAPYRGIPPLDTALLGLRPRCGLLGVTILTLLPINTFASDLTYQHNEQIYRISPQKAWQDVVEVPTYKGMELEFENGNIPNGITMKKKTIWNKEKIIETLERVIVPKIDRSSGSVRIFRDEGGAIAFDGVGLTGRRVNTSLAAELTLHALEENIPLIQLPVEETDPIIVDETNDGWQLIAIGESDFSGSPANRRHNIGIGLNTFDGKIIVDGEEFSFNKELGPVHGGTGYLKELTIMGEKTLPQYGGGLCQVSTTAFRGAWLAGLPITSRRNHSYAVTYYAPSGTDATIFPPWTDLKFTNDTGAPILLQTHVEENKAYFLYYGKKPKDRMTELVGPFIWDVKQPPEDKVEYTADLPPGEIRVVSRRVPGMKTMWYRYISEPESEPEPEPFLSEYEARPFYEERGTDLLPPSIITAPKRDVEVIKISEDTHITIPRNGVRIRVRRD